MAHGLKYNLKKTEVIVFRAGKLKPYYIPPVVLNNTPLKLVEKLKDLSHFLMSGLDLERGVRR